MHHIARIKKVSVLDCLRLRLGLGYDKLTLAPPSPICQDLKADMLMFSISLFVTIDWMQRCGLAASWC